MPRRFPVAVAIMTVLVIAASGCTASQPAAAATITVAVQDCGSGWTSPHPGQQTFVLKNRDIVAGEVFLVDATGAVVAYVDNVGPNATAHLSIDLGSGKYAFRCAMSDSDVAYGKKVTIAGHARGGVNPVRAVTTNDLVPAIKAYQSYVEDALPKLGELTNKLSGDIRSGDLASARRDWLPAHLEYERLGAAYGAFGDADQAINGTTAGLPKGVADPKFTGFHRIEYGLWHGQSASELRPIAAQLVGTIMALTRTFATARIQPLDIGIRAHEIAENALQFELTGQTNYGSNSNLATVGANLEGTAVVLGILHGVIAPRYPELAQTLAQLAKAKKDVAANDKTALDDLPTAKRELIDSDVSELTELLAPIASICEPRRTS
jgi:iron uptake system component EfeO